MSCYNLNISFRGGEIMAYFSNYCKFNEIRKYNHKHSNVSQHTENGTIFNGSMRIYWYLAREMVTSKLMRGIDWIQHHDVIVCKNLRFHPSRHLQQNGVYKTLNSGQRF